MDVYGGTLGWGPLLSPQVSDYALGHFAPDRREFTLAIPAELLDVEVASAS